MKGKQKTILWICLGLCLIAMYPGIKIRCTNESDNKSVIPVADYYDFIHASSPSTGKIKQIPDQFKSHNIKTLAVREITLSDLMNTMNISVSTLKDFLSSIRNTQLSGTFNAAIKQLRKSSPSLPSCIITPKSQETASFLEERLGNRFGSNEFFSFFVDGRKYFCIHKQVNELSEISLGFEDKTLSKLHQMGFDILLRPRNTKSFNVQIICEYEKIIRKFDIKYMIFDGAELPGAPDKLSFIENIIKKYGLITGIIESPAQVKYVPQKGLEDLFQFTDYAINRAYIIPDPDRFTMDRDTLFYRWLRCVVDRNIRFLYIAPSMNPRKSKDQNITDPLNAVKDLTGFISSRGYNVNQPLFKLSSRSLRNYLNPLALWSLILAAILYFFYLYEPEKKIRMVSTAVGIVLSLLYTVFNFLYPLDLSELLAMFASVVYPSLSALLFFKYIKFQTNRSILAQAFCSISVLLAVNTLGIYTITALLSDIRYMMNLDTYNWVIISFTIPILLIASSYIQCFYGRVDIKSALRKCLKTRPLIINALLFIGGAFVLFIYVARSGNFYLIPVSGLELRMRELLEQTLLARPRFKEFFIGYPSLLLFVYLWNHYKGRLKKQFLFLLAIAMGIGSVSMTNSFCHVFTPAAVSIHRTLNGLVLGSAIGVIVVLISHKVIQ